MPTDLQRVQALFDAAVDRPLEERASFLAEACGDDAELRAEVESRLEHDEAASADFMRPPEPRHPQPPAPPGDPDPLIGQQVGGFQIKGIIAAGGMGTV